MTTAAAARRLAMSARHLLALLLAAADATSNTSVGPYSATITSGVVFTATDGSPVHAHGAGLVPPYPAHPAGANGTYYLVGTTQKQPPNWLSSGVNLYASTDLQHWKFVSNIFNTSQIRQTQTRRRQAKRANPHQQMKEWMEGRRALLGPKPQPLRLPS